jgi:hypothetical protein
MPYSMYSLYCTNFSHCMLQRPTVLELMKCHCCLLRTDFCTNVPHIVPLHHPSSIVPNFVQSNFVPSCMFQCGQSERRDKVHQAQLENLIGVLNQYKDTHCAIIRSSANSLPLGSRRTLSRSLRKASTESRKVETRSLS